MTENQSPDLPWPGDELVYRVTGRTDREWFYESGQRSVADLEAVLSLVGRSIGSFGTVLDFGCGCGRILLWLSRVAATSELHGVDIDARAIGWVQDNLPSVKATANRPEPPLDHPDGLFDLVYNHSVFTHIDEKLQDQWLAELRRVTRPGGIVVLSVHGEHAFAEFETASRNAGGNPSPVRDRYRREGLVFVEEDPWVGSAFPDFYHTTFHAPWYVFDHWSRYFKVRAYVPQGSLGFQDFVLLERPPDDVPTHSGLGPSPAATGAPPPELDGRVAGAGTGAGADGGAAAAIEAVAARLARGPDLGSPTAFGGLSTLYRRLVLRALRHHDEHQRQVQADIVAALRELDAAGRAEPVAGLTLRESNVRLWDALRRHGERVNRLEADLWPPRPPAD